ncbi:F-box/kelch-repeat protein [Sesamum angolense]|uniref:F-box/kelch-repeat protein n=1 Tax=Sesamum angolense TaxID=2727404 RepID=A0AAE2BWH2_9LAMI|nr:F-box/kelch-repeat protein [Sesamum angolense]
MRDMGNLPDDAIAEILARLPIKSLSRFKCVSNSWNHLISHPSFLNLRALRKRSTRELRLIYVEHGKNTDGRIRITATDTEGKLINQFSLPGNSMKNSVDRLYPTRFDLVCFHNYRGEIWLCNPATRQILALPYPSQAVSKLDRFYGPYHNIGFGYSSSRDEYKSGAVIGFQRSERTNIWHILRSLLGVQKLITISALVAGGKQVKMSASSHGSCGMCPGCSSLDGIR